MTKNYFHAVCARGRTFNYFRPPKFLRDIGVGNIRLSDNGDVARQQARTMLEKGIAEHVLANLEDRVDEFRAHMQWMLNSAKSRSASKGLPCAITRDDVIDMMIRQGGRCAVSGKIFSAEKTNSYRRPYMPSIDRIDNRRGYEPDNCRLVCVIANYAMGEWGEEALIDLARHVTKWQNTRRTKPASKWIALPENRQKP